MPHLALWFKYSDGGLKDIKVSLCGLLYSKNRTRGAFMVPKEIEWNTWLQANKQAHGSTQTFFKVTKEQIGERMHTGVINWYTEAHVNLCSALWPFDFHFLFLSDCLNWGMAQKTSWSEEMTDSKPGRETNYFGLCWDPAKKRAGRQIKLGRTWSRLDMVRFIKENQIFMKSSDGLCCTCFLLLSKRDVLLQWYTDIL